jgi:DNA-binding NarL/FixJ family response regulator
VTPPRITVTIHAHDPISQAGVLSQLRVRPEITLMNRDAPAGPDPQVAVLVVDTVDDDARRLLRTFRRTSTARSVLVTADIDERKLVDAAECGVAGVVRRSQATPERLVAAITTVAQGDGHLPDDLVGRLLEEVGRLQDQVLTPRGLRSTGLNDREVDVLRLVAEGHDTAEIAAELAFCERTIKKVIQDVMTRMNLRNRAHAVAYATRHGFI